jgi:hypothetical protein
MEKRDASAKGEQMRREREGGGGIEKHLEMGPTYNM